MHAHSITLLLTLSFFCSSYTLSWTQDEIFEFNPDSYSLINNNHNNNNDYNDALVDQILNLPQSFIFLDAVWTGYKYHSYSLLSQLLLKSKLSSSNISSRYNNLII